MVSQKRAVDDREAFVSATLDQWAEIKRGDAAAGNRRQKAAQKIVERWGKANVAFGMLEPLLEHESTAVRLAAAAYIVEYGGTLIARTVLEKLSKGHHGPISTFADAVLQSHPLLQPDPINSG